MCPSRTSGLFVTACAGFRDAWHLLALLTGTAAGTVNASDDMDMEEDGQDPLEGDEVLSTAVDICQYLWLLAQSSTTMSFEDFALEEQDKVVDRAALGREVVIDLLQALLTVV